MIQRFKQAKRGYTIVEVMIVLAITGILFVAMIGLFKGQTGETTFNQSVYDLQSKLQNYANQVSSGVFPNFDAYSCSIDTTSGRPVPTVVVSANGVGSSQDCVYLGRAFQADTRSGQSNLYAYTILGSRDIFSGSSDTNVQATSFDQANPEPIFPASGTTTPDLTDQNNLLGSPQIISSKISVQGGEYDLVGFYSSMQSSSSTSQGTALFMRAYSFDSKTSGVKNAAVRSCLEQSTCVNGYDLGQWDLCIRSADGKQSAILSSKAISGTINVSLKYTTCQ